MLPVLSTLKRGSFFVLEYDKDLIWMDLILSRKMHYIINFVLVAKLMSIDIKFQENIFGEYPDKVCSMRNNLFTLYYQGNTIPLYLSPAKVHIIRM